MPGVIESLATALRCIDCGAAHALGHRLECPTCGGLLELVYDLAPLERAGPAAIGGPGLWRYAAALPIADPAHRVTLGEGQSPLLDCPARSSIAAYSARAGLRSLIFAYERASAPKLLNETRGVAGDASDEEILEAQQLLARTEGIWAGPTVSRPCRFSGGCSVRRRSTPTP